MSVQVKICGVQSVEEAQRLAELGVEFVGLNFVPASSRRIDLETGRHIVAGIQDTPVQIVALFQDQPFKFVQEYVQALRPHFIQLHGAESTAYVAKLRVPVIKAISVSADATAAQILQIIKEVDTEYYLLDRARRGRGNIIDATRASEVVRACPGKIFLAGGLGPDNLSGVLTSVQPFAVDIAGGVRTNDALDFAKVRRVLEIARTRP